MEKKYLTFRIKAFDEDTRIVEGYASTFGGKPDRHGDVIDKSAFNKQLPQLNKEGVPMFYNHDPNKLIGTFFSFKTDSKGLYVKGKIAETELGNEVYQLAKEGHLMKMSIGFIMLDSVMKSDHQLIKDVELLEISLVAIPANTNANVLAVKTALNDDSETIVDEEVSSIEEVSKSQEEALEEELEEVYDKDTCNCNCGCKKNTEQSNKEDEALLKQLQDELIKSEASLDSLRYRAFKASNKNSN